MSADVATWGPDVVALVLILAILGSAFFSGAETGMMSVSRARLARRAREGDRRVVRLERLRERLDDAILTCLVGTNLSNVLASAVTAALLTALLGPSGEGLAVLAASLVLVVLGEILPKILYREYPEQLSLVSLPLLEGFRWLISPLRWLLGAYAALLARLGRSAADDSARLDRLALASWLSGTAEASGEGRFRRTMVRFLQLSKRRVSDLMRPLTDVVTVPSTVSLAGALDEAARSGHSRLPVRGTDAELDGYLLFRDLLLAEGDHDPATRVPADLVRPLLLVDADLSPYELFEELHARGAQLAAVVDRAGRSLGIITLEDLIEKVTGAIADEFDPPEESP
jgi:CBS domain containing-hemolysin-like protein